MTAIDINRGSSNVLLPAEVSQEIWGKILEESAFMQLARRIAMPGAGVDIQTITGEPAADWVDETAAKPVATHSFGKKVIRPFKLAVIEPFSNEFKRDKAALYAECVRRLPYALAKKFDQTIIGTSAPGTGFDVLGNCEKISLNPGAGETVYGQFVAVDAAIAAADGIMNGIALAPQGKSKVIAAVDGQGRPLFTAGVGSGSLGNILGAPVAIKKGVYKAGTADAAAIVGVAGDFDDAVWGSVEGIQMAISDQATLTLADSSTVNLWQNNMFAIRFEIEVAFAVKNADEFILLTGDTATTTTTGA
ncbi:MAG: phage major capsid protein [Kiritimatiellae bacterium]|nr:phage major capsid protein [Kiritimatiellia bacterium]